jgi:hypothetical protein
MKKILNYLSIFSLVLVIFSCKKSGTQNPLADVKNLGVGSYITLAATTNVNFVYNTPTSTVSIKVNQYGGEVAKIILYVVQGSNANPASWKKIKEIPFTGNGTVLAATSQEVATALGVTVPSMSPGNFFTFYNQVITKDGRTFDLSNTLGALESNSNYSACFRWQAFITCPFVAPVAGNWRVVQDDWQDWSPGDIVTVLDGPGANQINLRNVWPNPAYGFVVNPLIVNIDPATGTATVPLVNFANGYPGSATAQGASASGAGDTVPCGYVFSCTGFITLTMLVKYNGSSQGNLKLVLQKL